MKAAFGLVGLLVTLGVIVWIMSAFYLPYTKTAIQIQQKQTPRVQQFGGYDNSSGAPINTTYKLEPQEQDGKVQSLLVTSLDPNSAMVKVYGLQRDDSIVAISWHGDMERVRDVGDAEAAEDRIIEAYRGSEPIIVMRDGQEMTLKANTQSPASIAQSMLGGGNGNANSGNNNSSANNNSSGKDSLQQQLNAIQQVPTH
jgi:hypothetical protein